MSDSSIQLTIAIANIVIALSAVVGLILTAITLKNAIESSIEALKISNDTSKRLNQISKTFAQAYDILEPFSKPLLKLVDFKWLITDEKLSCEDPPHGIVLYFKNVSIVPIEVFDSDLQVFYGKKLFDDVTHKVGENKTHHLLVPGETLSTFTDQSELFKKYLSNRRSLLEEPTIIVELKVSFSKLNSGDRIVYHTKQKIFFDCEHPLIKSKQAIFEKYYYETDKNT